MRVSGPPSARGARLRADMLAHMNMAAAEDGIWDVAAYRGPLPVSDATYFMGGDPIPAQGSLAPDTISHGCPPHNKLLFL